MLHELYCFMHGLPTKHAGSWMPTTDNVLCGKAECRGLPKKWSKEVLEGSRRSWDARRSEECSICHAERQRRCRVIHRGEAEKMLQVKFLDAPLIHPYNAPKYHASLIRAQQYAFRTGRILLWAAAEDQPCHPDHTCLSAEELDGKRAEWCMLHDQRTGGIMGLQPLAINMPLRITQTDQGEKATLFKNRRCKLYGWKLHAVDLARLDACVEREMALEYLPEELLLKFEGVSWVWSKDLGPGIMAVKPKVVDWYLDRACKVRVRRKGFTVASDFSGTGHSFAGASLAAAIVDCLPWDSKPDKQAQIGGYM